ncbi:hypothetical protein PPERSA_10448 [Pseudocohnilembus persalinus]|uniref:Peroxisomal membrane protein 4 n=1 Tax=Pseudocohnilembus persalinus TaxID=266149 RepID=A0A0V0R0L1_PSEPJ|nr:hypothetical protein PPERSA_10448 [Pseudocohnilembus persalinus]|eukprot:KRX08086.1 hypothetical protein PPERSA_10448 [Pseudocohnilembus persalinus]
MSDNISNKQVCSHEGPCWLSSVKGLRQGIYYGMKIRFFHALVMTMLFKQGTLKQKIQTILKLTYEHAKRLGSFVFLYKSGVCLLNKIQQKQSKLHNIIAGGVMGYVIWGKQTAVNNQMILYLLSRVIHGGFTALQERNIVPKIGVQETVTNSTGNQTTIKTFFPILAASVWALVMYLFEMDFEQKSKKKPALQGSLYGSMDFLYKQSDTRLNDYSELVPFKIPEIISQYINTHIKNGNHKK